MNIYKVTYKRVERSYKMTGMAFIEAESKAGVKAKFYNELCIRLVQNPHHCEIIKIENLAMRIVSKNTNPSEKDQAPPEISKEVVMERALSGNDPFYHAVPKSDHDAVNQWCTFIRNTYSGDDQKQEIEQYIADILCERPAIIQTYEKHF